MISTRLGSGEDLLLDRKLGKVFIVSVVLRLTRAEQDVLKLLVACDFVLVQQLDAGFQRLLGHELFDIVGHDSCFRLFGDFEVFAFVDSDDDLEIAEVQVVAVEQSPGIALTDRLSFFVDVDAIRTDVGEVVDASLAVDRRVLTGYVLVGVWQDPVVIQRAADRAAFLTELTHSIITDDLAMLADDFEFERHTSPAPSQPHGGLPRGQGPCANSAVDEGVTLPSSSHNRGRWAPGIYH